MLYLVVVIGVSLLRLLLYCPHFAPVFSTEIALKYRLFLSDYFADVRVYHPAGRLVRSASTRWRRCDLSALLTIDDRSFVPRESRTVAKASRNSRFHRCVNAVSAAEFVHAVRCRDRGRRVSRVFHRVPGRDRASRSREKFRRRATCVPVTFRRLPFAFRLPSPPFPWPSLVIRRTALRRV